MATLTSAGIGSGLDVNSIVTQLMEIERLPLDRLQDEKVEYEAQISAYGSLSSSLSSFQEAMEDLSSVDALKLYTTTSSNEDVIGLSASSDAELGTFGLEVVRLAENHKLTSLEIADTATFGGTAGDSLSIQVGTDVANTITVDLSAASTLSDIRTAINEDANNPGVTATIINGDDGNQKLVLTANDTGEASALTISTAGSVLPADFGFTTVNDIGGDFSLLDAEIKVDGYTITRASNDISDVISGVTLNLESADPGNTHIIGIERDLETVEEVVQGFADAYNALGAAIDSLRAGELEADSSLLTIETQILDVLNSPATGAFETLSEIGLTLQKDGTMELDTDNLQAALASDYSGVADLFAADGDGFANRLESLVDGWLGFGGLIETRTDGLNARIDDNLDSQESMERNLAIVEARYWDQFSALDALVGQLQGTEAFLTDQLANLPGAASG